MNTRTVARIVRISFFSLMCVKFFSTFSTKVVDGARIVAEAVDITAESTAPKKRTRSHIGM